MRPYICQKERSWVGREQEAKAKQTPDVSQPMYGPMDFPCSGFAPRNEKPPRDQAWGEERKTTTSRHSLHRELSASMEEMGGQTSKLDSYKRLHK